MLRINELRVVFTRKNGLVLHEYKDSRGDAEHAEMVICFCLSLTP